MSWESEICISILAQETLVCTADLPDPSLALLTCFCPTVFLFFFFNPAVLHFFSTPPVSWGLFGHSWQNLVYHLCDFHCLSSALSHMNLATQGFFASPRLHLWDASVSCGDWISTSIHYSGRRWIDQCVESLQERESQDGWIHAWIRGCLLIGGRIDWSFLPMNRQFYCVTFTGNVTQFQ